MFPNKEKQKLLRCKDLRISLLFQKMKFFFMELAPALDVSFILLSIPFLFLFHCPLLFVYSPACLCVFTLMSFNFNCVEVSHHMLISKACGELMDTLT